MGVAIARRTAWIVASTHCRWTRLWGLLLALAAPLHAARADLPPGLHTGLQTQHQGTDRTYDVLIPASYDGSTLVPLLIELHPSRETTAFQRSVSGFAALAETEGFIVAWPQALGSTKSWNAGAFCVSPFDDVGFIRVLVATLRAENRIDPNQVYVTGLSCGAAMTNRLACEAADVFAAAAPVNGPGALVPCTPSRAIPILLTHSRVDTWVPYDGPHLWGCPGCVFPGARAQFETWRDRNSCTGSSPDVTENPGTTSVCERYTTCGDGIEVGLCSVDSAFTHPTCVGTMPPPGSLPCSLWDGHVSYAPYVLDGFSPQQRIWNFLKSFALGPPTGVPVFPYGPSLEKPRSKR
jgi:polyhydroxybutyrate depolymerase